MPPRKKIADNVLVLDSPEVKKSLEEREDLFAVGGVTYTMLKNPSAALMMKVMTKASEDGEAAAVDFALREMLTEEGYKAFEDCETLTHEHFAKVTEIVMGKVMGSAAVDPKDPSENSGPENS